MYENAYDWSSGGKVWTLQIVYIMIKLKLSYIPLYNATTFGYGSKILICIVFFILFSTSRFICSPIWALKVSFNIEVLAHKMRAWNSSYWNIVCNLECMKSKDFPNIRIWVSMNRFLLWDVEFFNIDKSIIMHLNNHLQKNSNTT